MTEESYMVRKWNAGEVHVKENGVCGWLFDTGEFRPLMGDVMQELLDEGLVTDEHVVMTALAHDVYLEESIASYREREERFWTDPEFEDARQERLFEMRAAFGPDEEVVNVLTGRRTRT